MSKSKYVLVDLVGNYDVVGIAQYKSRRERKTLEKKYYLYREFSSLSAATNIGEILSRRYNSLFVGIIDINEEYLVFKHFDDDGLFVYVTTRRNVSHALEVNQGNDGIPWETVHAVLDDYEQDSTVALVLYEWLSCSDIIKEQTVDAICLLPTYINRKRHDATIRYTDCLDKGKYLVLYRVYDNVLKVEVIVGAKWDFDTKDAAMNYVNQLVNQRYLGLQPDDEHFLARYEVRTIFFRYTSDMLDDIECFFNRMVGPNNIK